MQIKWLLPVIGQGLKSTASKPCAAVFGHHIPEISTQLGLAPDLFTSSKVTYIPACFALLGAPAGLAWAAHQLAAPASEQRIVEMLRVAPAAGGLDLRRASAAAAELDSTPADLVSSVYGYMPLVWVAAAAEVPALSLRPCRRGSLHWGVSAAAVGEPCLQAG